MKTVNTVSSHHSSITYYLSSRGTSAEEDGTCWYVFCRGMAAGEGAAPYISDGELIYPGGAYFGIAIALQ